MRDLQLELADRELQTLDLLGTALRSGVDKDKFVTSVDSDGQLSALLGVNAIALSLEELSARVGSVRATAGKLQMNKKARKILITLSTATAVLGGLAYLKNRDSLKAGSAMLVGAGLSFLFSEKTQNSVKVVPAKTLIRYLEVAKTIPTYVEELLVKTKATPKTLTDESLDKFKTINKVYLFEMKEFWDGIEHPPRVVLKEAGYTKEIILKLKSDAEHLAQVVEALTKKLETIAAPYWDYAEKYYWDADEDSENFDQGYLARIYAEHVLCLYLFYCNCATNVIQEIAEIAKLMKVKA